MPDAEKIIDDIIRREGGFVDHPDDRGGPTKYGITQATLAEFRTFGATPEDVRELTETEAREIYRFQYIHNPRFDQIQSPMLAGLVIDCGVNHGTKRAARWLQEAAGVTSDGVIGPVTLQAVNSGNASHLYRAVLARRFRFYGQIITKDHSQAVFAAGWMNRAAEFLEAL